MNLVMRACVLLVPACLVSAMGACQTLQSAIDNMDKPGARVTGVHLAGLSTTGVGLNFDVEITNPYGVDLPVIGLQYGLASAGKSFLTGSAPSQGVVPARGNKTIMLPATIRFTELFTALSGVKPGAVVPYKADIALTVDAPAIGTLALPITKSGELPVPAAPDVRITDLAWDELSWDRAAATLTMRVKNTNQFTTGLSRMSYELSLAGMPVGSGMAKGARDLKAGESETLTVPLTFSPSSLGLAALDVLQGKDPSYTLRGGMTLSTPFGELDAPLQSAGTAKTK